MFKSKLLLNLLFLPYWDVCHHWQFIIGASIFWSIFHHQEEDNMAIVEKMVADVDLDSNGEISFDEFCTMMDSR